MIHRADGQYTILPPSAFEKPSRQQPGALGEEWMLAFRKSHKTWRREKLVYVRDEQLEYIPQLVNFPESALSRYCSSPLFFDRRGMIAPLKVCAENITPTAGPRT